MKTKKQISVESQVLKLMLEKYKTQPPEVLKEIQTQWANFSLLSGSRDHSGKIFGFEGFKFIKRSKNSKKIDNKKETIWIYGLTKSKDSVRIFHLDLEN